MKVTSLFNDSTISSIRIRSQKNTIIFFIKSGTYALYVLVGQLEVLLVDLPLSSLFCTKKKASRDGTTGSLASRAEFSARIKYFGR